MSNYNEYNNQNVNQDNNFMNNMVNENFINMAQSIDLDNLNGTNIMDLNKENFNTMTNMPTFNLPNNLPNNMPIVNSIPFNNMGMMNNMQNIEPMNQLNQMNQIQQTNKMNQMNPMGQDPQLIKSITRELINNLKENNLSLHDDNTTYHSKKTKNNIDNDDKNSNNYDLSDGTENFENTHHKNKTKKSKKTYKDEIQKGIEHMLSENGVPASENVSSYIFDDLFNIKDFVILFGVYFLLSQEMIKDLFAQYFTSLDPDDTGKVHVKGVIIYGLILTILFMVLRKII
jgi:hypothetical protein